MTPSLPIKLLNKDRSDAPERAQPIRQECPLTLGKPLKRALTSIRRSFQTGWSYTTSRGWTRVQQRIGYRQTLPRLDFVCPDPAEQNIYKCTVFTFYVTSTTNTYLTKNTY